MFTTDPNDSRLGRGVDKEKTPQHEVYLILSDEEKAKGFIRPVRRTYIHIGQKIRRYDDGRLYGKLIHIDNPEYPQHDHYTKENGYKGYQLYPKTESHVVGKYLKTEEYDAIVKRKTHFGGCGAATTMPTPIAETYAANPNFYGSTYCCTCQKHLPVEEFAWEDGSIVGS